MQSSGLNRPRVRGAKGILAFMAKRDRGLLADIEEAVLSDASVADALRKCVILGGRAGSVDLREWATKELRGYQGDDALPEYRTVAAPIMLDGATMNAQITGQRIGLHFLPDFAREHIGEEVPLRSGIGEIEALIQGAEASGKGSVNLSLPSGADLASYISGKLQGQRVISLYWSVSASALKGVVDQVRTTLTELIAEIRAGLPEGEEVPSHELANQAVHVAVHGDKSRVQVTTAQSSSGGSGSVGLSDDVSGWSMRTKVGAGFGVLISLAGLVLGLGEVLNWW